MNATQLRAAENDAREIARLLNEKVKHNDLAKAEVCGIIKGLLIASKAQKTA